QRFNSRRSEAGHMDSGATIKRRNKGYEAEMPPEIDDYASVAFVLKHMNMGGFEEIFQACMMKWNDEGRITIEINQKAGKKLDKSTTKIMIHYYPTMVEDKSESFKDCSTQLKNNKI